MREIYIEYINEHDYVLHNVISNEYIALIKWIDIMYGYFNIISEDLSKIFDE